MNFLTMIALGAAVLIFCMMDWKETDAQGRKFFGRLESGAMLPNDRIFIKLMAWALGSAAAAYLIFGAG